MSSHKSRIRLRLVASLSSTRFSYTLRFLDNAVGRYI